MGGSGYGEELFKITTRNFPGWSKLGSLWETISSAAIHYPAVQGANFNGSLKDHALQKKAGSDAIQNHGLGRVGKFRQHAGIPDLSKTLLPLTQTL